LAGKEETEEQITVFLSGLSLSTAAEPLGNPGLSESAKASGYG